MPGPRWPTPTDGSQRLVVMVTHWHLSCVGVAAMTVTGLSFPDVSFEQVEEFGSLSFLASVEAYSR